MRYDFLTETYETERIKVISAWSMFRDSDLAVRPHPTDTRGRSFHEHMVHQCVSEDVWFRTMLDIDVGAPPLPKEEVRLEFMRQYAEDSKRRLAAHRKRWSLPPTRPRPFPAVRPGASRCPPRTAA